MVADDDPSSTLGDRLSYEAINSAGTKGDVRWLATSYSHQLGHRSGRSASNNKEDVAWVHPRINISFDYSSALASAFFLQPKGFLIFFCYFSSAVQLHSSENHCVRNQKETARAPTCCNNRLNWTHVIVFHLIQSTCGCPLNSDPKGNLKKLN